jgi:GDP-mannose 6-dehydrogenase
MKIAVFGLGYVGVTAAACLAREGHEVIGVDINDDKISAINAGRSPIAEPGLDDLIKIAVEKGSLAATKDPSTHLNSCQIAIVCVGTPSTPDGSHNMGYVAEVSRQIASLIDPARDEVLTVVYRSTMRPGTMDDLIRPIFDEALNQKKECFELVYNPEFLRESVAVEDFFNPPKIVIGTRDARACPMLDRLNSGIQAPVFYTNYREAELTKFVDNTFHAVKIAFANEIGRVCSQLGISTRTVHQIFVSDTKLNISAYYFRPGGAFGGSCLPKDVRALQHIASDVGAHTHLVDSLVRSNEAHKHFLFEICAKGLPLGAKVLMLGLAFKADSDDLRESPNVDLARKFLQANYDLSIYDPHVQPSKLLGQNLGYAFSNLPTMRKLLVSREAAETAQFDLVVDTRGWARSLVLNAGRIVDINTLH